MLIREFFEKFPDEASCRSHFKTERDGQGVCCVRCEHKQHYWISTREQYECKKCKYRTTLRSGTIMHGSQLPFYYWYYAIMLLTSTKKSFSAAEVQRQLEHRYYEPIWAMLHKLRHAMGERDSKYTLSGEMEMDEGFFAIVPDQEEREVIAEEIKENGGKLKRGKGSQKNVPVLVIAESKAVTETKKNRPNRAVRYIKMTQLPDITKATINKLIEKSIDTEADVKTDGANCYNDLKEQVKEHQAEVIEDKKESGKVLPWVHIVIANTKRLLLNTHHSISKTYLQRYLDEFCYNFNRRYFDSPFDRLIVASVHCSWKNYLQVIR